MPNKTLEISWAEIENENSDLVGGCFAPTDCKARIKTAIIVPYKDSSFTNSMNRFA